MKIVIQPFVYFFEDKGIFTNWITRFFIRKWSIRKWGYRGQKNKKVEGQNAPNLRKWPYTSFISFGNLTFRNALFTLLKNKY